MKYKKSPPWFSYTRYWLTAAFLLVLGHVLFSPRYPIPEKTEQSSALDGMASELGFGSSEVDQDANDPARPPLGPIDRFFKLISGDNLVSSPEVTSRPFEACSCQIPGSPKDQLHYQSYEEPSCQMELTVDVLKQKKKQRFTLAKTDFKAGIEAIPEEFRSKREPFPEANFPSSCVLFILRNYMQAGDDRLTKGFTHCPSPTGQPPKESGHYKPCITPDYVHSIYNSYIDVANCLEIKPQGKFLPKFAHESGMQMNAINTRATSYDAGIGQLTEIAIKDVNDHAGKLEERINSSELPSCKRVKNYPGLFSPSKEDPAYFNLVEPSHKVQSRCEFLTAPLNPIRNLLYAMYSSQLNNKRVSKILKEVGISVKELKALGVEKAEAPQVFERLKAHMEILSYNLGTGSLEAILQTYMERRRKHAKVAPLKAKHFSPDHKMDFKKRLDELKAQCLKEKNPEKPCDQISTQDIRVRELGLFDFLSIYQQTGDPNYIRNLNQRRAEIDAALGKNECQTHF